MSKQHPSLVRLVGVGAALLLLLLPYAFACSGSGGGGGGGGNGGGGGGGDTPLVIPQQSDWTSRGSTGISASGVPGDWNYRIDGAISPVDAVKRGGIYYLYYIGASGDRSSDGGPARRALGVATSNNGMDFVPHPSNPIVTNVPNNNEEEGIFSGAVEIDDGGTTLLMYGALVETSGGATSVFSDGRLTTSGNGIAFSPVPGTIELAHDDGSVFNNGDELYPIGVFRDGSMFHLYYTSQGSLDNWLLGVASGSSSNLTSTQGITSPPINGSQEIIGGGAVVYDTDDTFLLFLLRDFSQRVLQVHEVPTSNPADIGNPIMSYTGFPNVQNFTVLLDEGTDTWFLYIAELSFIRVYTAPAMRM